MASREEAEVFEGRARAFLAAARDSLKAGRFDVACLEAEQAAQLAIKAALIRIGGAVPRSHSLRRILASLGTAVGAVEKASRFVREWRAELLALEDAYLRSRYGVEIYSREEAEICLSIAREVVEWVASLVGEMTRQSKSGEERGEWREVAVRVAQAARKVLGPGVEVVVFGSLPRGEGTGSSDLDILVITPRVLPRDLSSRARIKVDIEEEAGLPPLNMVELHLASQAEVEANPIYREAIEVGLHITP